MDRQATVSGWGGHQHADTPEVVQIDATQLDDIMLRLRVSDFDDVFIDTPGVDSPGSLAAIRAADFCLAPCRPTPADLLNQMLSRSYRVRDAADGLAVLEVPPDVNIVMRNDHRDALRLGQGVTEYNPTGMAANEIRSLCSWIAKRTQGIPSNVKAA